MIENNYFYLSSDGTYYIVGEEYNCSGAPNPAISEINGHLDIPAEYNGKPVKEIGTYAFYGCSPSSITIPDSVTLIGDYAFAYCSALTSIIVDPNNTVYKSEGNCIIEKTTNKLIVGCKTSIIPDYVTSIGKYAFYDCKFLTSINIPDSVTSIDYYAFSYCKSLKNVIIKGKTTVSSYAFKNTTELEKIYVIEGKGYSPTDTLDGKPIVILPADGAVVAKTMSVKSMSIS